MTNRRWQPSKLDPWRSSPWSWLHPHCCSCCNPRHGPTTKKDTNPAHPTRKLLRTTSPRKKLTRRRPLAKRNRPPQKTLLRSRDLIARNPGPPREKNRKRQQAVRPVVPTEPQLRAPRRMADRDATDHTGRIRVTVPTPMGPTIRTTTPVMVHRPRTAKAADPQRDDRVRVVWATPMTSSHPVRPPTGPMTTTGTSVTGTRASARRTRLTPGASCHCLRHGPQDHLSSRSHRSSRCHRTRCSRSHPSVRFHQTRYSPSRRSATRPPRVEARIVRAEPVAVLPQTGLGASGFGVAGMGLWLIGVFMLLLSRRYERRRKGTA